MSETVLVVKDFRKVYGDHVAVDGISFEVQRGEVFGYIGPNGAGKTTTIKTLVGLLTQFQGTVAIAGQRMPQNKGEVHKMLGYLPQQVAFQDWRTVDHMLRTFGQLSGMPRGALDRRISEVLGLLDLTPVRFKRVAELSGGTVQRVGLAQALLHAPPLLVLDEPLASLDPTSRHQVKTVIRQLSREGTTILFSSHILSDVQDVATRVAILNKGRLVHVGTLEELLHELRLADEVEMVLSRNSGCWHQMPPPVGVRTIKEPAPDKLLIQLDTKADRDETVHQLLADLMAGGCRVRSFQPVTRSLDDIYLKSLEGGAVA
jgi:ABC-2 type transport system ATP-binding protein